MNTVQEIQPIVNGSVNPNLTPELFSSLDLQTKRQVIWNVVVSLGFAHCFQDVDYSVFQPSDYKLSYDELQAYSSGDTLDKLFVEVKEQYNAHHNKMLAKTANHRFELGKKIHKAQKELGFGGMITLDKDRMKGYISANGNWNEFNSTDVCHAIGKMDALAPRKDYGPNNPNTGAKAHEWKSVSGGEYVLMEYDFIGEEQLERVKEFYNTHWEPVGKSIKADSIRYVVTEHGSGYFGIELIWWWD
ncbi:MAG: hypothetical protein LLF94_02660 [Chlamydiales bacterium]|nr:hypothetical protein [Chlamydiales bacterium]